MSFVFWGLIICEAATGFKPVMVVLQSTALVASPYGRKPVCFREERMICMVCLLTKRSTHPDGRFRRGRLCSPDEYSLRHPGCMIYCCAAPVACSVHDPIYSRDKDKVSHCPDARFKSLPLSYVTAFLLVRFQCLSVSNKSKIVLWCPRNGSRTLLYASWLPWCG